ncbi:MAG: ATP-dependent DNA helicase RecG [Candidatus Sericytochromatia bacterium]|nr:ATP-dependent DNA helicase RecG [Candidatus Tanganyikabacteria bacterium]
MPLLDAERLLQALKVEAQHDYCDLQGRTARFSDFVQEQLADLIPKAPPGEGRARFERLKREFADYRTLDMFDRADLISRLRGAIPLLAATPVLTASLPGDAAIAVQSGADGARTGQEAAAGNGQQKRSDAPPRGSGPLAAPVTTIKGVGSYLTGALERLGLEAVADVLAHYPRSHLDYATRTRIRDLQEGQPVTIWGTIRRAEAFTPPRRPTLSINSVTIADGTGITTARWFMAGSSRGQQEAWKRRYPPGHQILLSGVPKRDGRSGRLVFERPEAEVIGPGEDEDGAESLHVGRVVPVYRLTEGLSQKALRRVIHQAVDQAAPYLADPLPEAIRRRCDLVDMPTAVRDIHFPESLGSRDAARRRLVFDELFWLQLGLAFKRAQIQGESEGLVLSARPDGLVAQFVTHLPFELTGAQKRVYAEIAGDLARPQAMNRLVQGDVGSGKTVVALMALLSAVENGYQGALMAPTEILAEQHYQTFKKLLAPLKIEVALLLGKQTKKHRGVYLDALATGFCKLAVGTHALIQEGVRFQNLGLVIVDEQHRFGVRQRKLLRDKGPQVEVLTMTATPIPRTLAMALYGDLDVSAIDEMPPGCEPVTTRWLKGKAGRKQTFDLVKREVKAGRQAYVVFPLVEESEKLDLKSATQEYERLGAGELKELRLGLLHGQMPPDEKEAVVAAFRAGEIDALVATTVVEVGVDVPNATVMVVENAERFGLSQLHQLRGRVGRGGGESFCILLTDADTQGARERLEVMVATHDGFVIAQKDLQLRGPGEFIGTRQSGVPDLLLADLRTDEDLLAQARECAFEVVAEDPTLARHPELAEGMRGAYRQNLSFLGIG